MAVHQLHSCEEAGRCARPGDPRCSAPHPGIWGIPESDGTCAVGGVGVWPPPCCLECPSCEGRGEEVVEVFTYYDQTHEDVQDCRVCKGTGQRGGRPSGSGDAW